MKPSIGVLLLLTLYVVNVKSSQVFGQSIPVGSVGTEDAIRRAQLLGYADESLSFAARPLSTQEYNSLKSAPIGCIKGMPLIWKQQYNSDHPEGLNDGAMIPARGYQTLISGGIFAKYGLLRIQFMPEFVFAENRAYQGFPDEHPDKIWKIYNNLILNQIDLPERFGETAYQKAFWGQSCIRLTWKTLSMGLSNENLWWGPGIQNALLMTNNGPGFKHITLNTVKPIHTIIGSFEGQLVSGRLEASGYPGMDSVKLLQHKITYTAKPDDWRYLNGIVLSYQPRWLPGLYLGATRSFICYHQDLGSRLNDFLPVIIPMFKKEVGDAVEDQKKRDQLVSVFMRWVAPESHAEIYMEYGREDHNYDLTDFILEPDHLRAYILGFRKLLPLKGRRNEFWDIQAEITQFGKNKSTSLRSPGAAGWYDHSQVRDGYTHMGQYLGSGLGTSSNMQSMSVSWVKGMKRFGVEAKRIAHEENFWAYAIKDNRAHWVDLGGALIGEWDYKNMLFNAKLGTTGSINYQFLYEGKSGETSDSGTQWWNDGKIRYNVHAELGVAYQF